MRPDTLREILLVKAIEESDRAGQVIAFGERERAARDALRAVELGTAEIGQPAAAGRVARALAARAARLSPPLLQRHPALGDLLARSGWPTWVGLALIAVAAFSGYGLSAMNESRRINILALPFLGLLAWNLAIYLLLAFGGLQALTTRARSAGRWTGSAVRSLGRRLGPLVARIAQVDTLLGEAVRRFVTDWSRAGAPVLAQQMRLWLHLAAAALAVGLIAGLYQRGIGRQYVAGWESTWLGAPQVRALIDLVFGPLAAWAGIPLPRTVADVAALEFRPDGTGGGTAAPWIHLIALSLAVTVVLPRTLLASWAGLRAFWLARRGRLPDELIAYAGKVLGAGGQGQPVAISVIPYAYAPGAEVAARLEPVVQEMYGRSARPRLEPPIAYGEEEAARSVLQQRDEGEVGCLLLMNLAATPETENHGLVIDLARDRAGEGLRHALPYRLVVDEASYAERFGAERLEQRRALWREFAAKHGIEIAFLPAGAA